MAKTKRPPQTAKKLGGPRVSPDGPRRSKVDAVEDFKARLDSASAAIMTEYRGMTVGELAELRAGLREAGTEYKVFKNTLAAIAVKDLGHEDLIPLLDGPTAIAFTGSDPVEAAKKLADFAKKVPTLILKGGFLDGKVLSEAQVKSLASLDSREVMLAKVAGMFASPLQKVAYLFAAPLQQVGALFAQLKDKLPAESAPAPTAEAPAEAPAAAEPAPEAVAEETPAEAPAEASNTDQTEAASGDGTAAQDES